MITQASITVAPDGGILITLPRTKMDLSAETLVSYRAGKLRIGQGKTPFVVVDLEDAEVVAALGRTEDVSVVEVDDVGFEFHEKVRRM